MKTGEYLMSIGNQEKQFDALYRNVGTFFGLPDCAMWILYFLSSSEQELSQQDLIEKMMFPKQTINSAVTGLAKKGLVELCMIPGTRNRKKVMLTETGKALAENTVYITLNGGYLYRKIIWFDAYQSTCFLTAEIR